MFDLGIQELIVIFIVALVVFGPKKLPELGRNLGKGLAELKNAMQGVKDQMDTELHDIKHTVSLEPEKNVAPPDKEKAPEHSSDAGDKAVDGKQETRADS